MATKTSKPATKAKDTKTTKPAPVAPVDKTRHLQIICVPGKTEDRMLADLVTDGLASNASTAMRYIKPEQGDVSLTDMVASLRDHGEAVNRGDLAAAERMLNAQAVALNAMFSEMARVAQLNMFKAPEFADRYLRLALKAQSQSRATVETLAAIKNPPVVFARQANISNGPQQVNNGVAAPASHAQAEDIQSPPNELLEAKHEKWLDTRATGTAGRTDPRLATVETVNRPADGGGQGSRSKQRIQRRAPGPNARADQSGE